MDPGRQSRRRPPLKPSWALGLAAVVVILAAGTLLQHTLPLPETRPVGFGFAEDSYRQDLAPEWAGVPESETLTATGSPETPPAAAPVGPASEIAEPQGFQSTVEADQSAAQGWLAAGNEQKRASKGADQEERTYRPSTKPAEAEPLPSAEPADGLAQNAPRGKAKLEQDWERQAGEKKVEPPDEAPTYTGKSPLPAFPMAPLARGDGGAVIARSNDGRDEDTSYVTRGGKAPTNHSGLLLSEAPARGERGREGFFGSLGQVRSETGQVGKYERRVAGEVSEEAVLNDEVFEQPIAPGLPAEMPRSREREEIAGSRFSRVAPSRARPAVAPQKPVSRDKADNRRRALTKSEAAAESGPQSQAAKEQPHRSLVGDDRLQQPSPGTAGGRPLPAPLDLDKARQAARRYLAQSTALEGLHFQEPTGYWANTYVPGDPAMRLLQTRLSRWDRRGIGGDLRLEKAAHQSWQPFDPPRNAALALYLDADQAAIQGPTRLRVQVGLKGTPRQGGLRSAMNLGLVLDLRGLAADDTGAGIRALVSALQEARQPGDHFSITVAGRPGALLVPPQSFRNGPIRLAMKALFGEETPTDKQTLDLMQALTLAKSTVQAGDDPTATLGTRVILLVTASPLGAQLPALEGFAHRGALEGVPLSVAALGDAANLDEIDRLVRAGQGNRRILRGPNEAADLVQRELSAVSRVVARAVRLRIRLAPQVKLIQVLGSRRLDTAQTQRVRQAEKSIDQRMARNLGLKADRGEDEEGIQIVIPSFFADDNHVVLLDVVAERPGLIADAQVRYKDLVFLRNGVARTRLNLDEGQRDPGPLELRVLKNRLAMELAVSARQAGHWLASGNPQQAVALLTRVRDLLYGMRYEIAGWSMDPELQNDVAMVGEYLAMLGSPVVGDAIGRSLLADSLRYAAHRRLLSVAQ